MRYLITGITGSLGTAVAKILANEPRAEIVGYSRDEFKQSKFVAESGIDCDLTLYLGDVRDRDRLVEASRDVDLIFHFAALKHVDKLEANPEEAIETNVIGTSNVMHAQRMNRIDRVVLSATDKGVYPINTYGMTKGLSERLVLRNRNNIVCRYGNVLASRGSVIPSFIKTLRESKRIDLTHPDMTRFWITLKDAAQFVVERSFSKTGGIFCPKMMGAPVRLVAQCVAEILRIKDFEEKIIGVRPGEKIHEALANHYEAALMGDDIMSYAGFESNSCRQFVKGELKELLAPIVKELM